GWKILGRNVLHLSLLGTFSVTIWLAIFEKLPFIVDLDHDLIIVSMLAGVLSGIGLGIIFKAGGTTGGSDILARIGHKYSHYT
ncbi:YitT family protein, partial [Streptococcus pyogenes]